MSNFIKEMVKNRLRRVTVDELLYYASDYGFSLTREEASAILSHIKMNDFDIFSKQAIADTHMKIADITDVQTANKAQRLFEQIISSYGLEYLFE